MRLNRWRTALTVAISLLLACKGKPPSTVSKDPGQAISSTLPLFKHLFSGINERDTATIAQPPNPEIYEVIGALLKSKDLTRRKLSTRYNCVAKADIACNSYLKYYIEEKKLSIDTAGLYQRDTAIYAIDWSKLQNKDCITVKEIYSGSVLFFKSFTQPSIIYQEDSFSSRKAFFRKAFKSDRIILLSYPQFNTHKTVCAVIVADINAVDDGSVLYLLKQKNGKWRIAATGLISAT